MSLSSLIARALAWLMLGAGAAHAASVPASAPAPDATDPQAAVPATAYAPAIGYRTEAPPAGTPDRNWQASNAAVTRPTMMAQHGHAGHAGHAEPQPSTPAAHQGMQHMQHQQHQPDVEAQQCKPGDGCGDGCGGCACCTGKQSMQDAGHRHGDHP